MSLDEDDSIFEDPEAFKWGRGWDFIHFLFIGTAEGEDWHVVHGGEVYQGLASGQGVIQFDKTLLYGGIVIHAFH